MRNLKARLDRLERKERDRGPRLQLLALDAPGGAAAFVDGAWVPCPDPEIVMAEQAGQPLKVYVGFHPGRPDGSGQMGPDGTPVR